MLHELEQQMLLLEHELLSFAAANYSELLPVVKRFLNEIASLPVEERTLYMAETSEVLLQLQARKELKKEWQEVKQEISNEENKNISAGLLDVFEKNLDAWLPYMKQGVKK